MLSMAKLLFTSFTSTPLVATFSFGQINQLQERNMWCCWQSIDKVSEAQLMYNNVHLFGM